MGDESSFSILGINNEIMIDRCVGVGVITCCNVYDKQNTSSYELNYKERTTARKDLIYFKFELNLSN